MHLFDLKAWFTDAARRCGYKVERLIQDVNTIEVFDVFVDRLNLQNDGKVSFVQVGAHDGRSDDPLRKHILANRWSGVLVEPQPEMFRLLQQNYSDQPQLRFANVALARSDGPTTLYLPAEQSSVSARTFLA